MIAGMVLAAGASQRMGFPKSLLQIRGRCAVDHVADVLRAGGVEPVIVVLGAHRCRIRGLAKLEGVTQVENLRWQEGRTTSIQAGIDALPPEAEAVVMALVDMPLVEPATVRSLIRAFRESRARCVLPAYGKRTGHPALLSRSLFPAIGALAPDASLRVVVRTASPQRVPVDDTGILTDFDTPASMEGCPDVRPPPPSA